MGMIELIDMLKEDGRLGVNLDTFRTLGNGGCGCILTRSLRHFQSSDHVIVYRCRSSSCLVEDFLSCK